MDKIDSDDQNYKGDMVDGKYHGQGILKYEIDGDDYSIYSGEWKEGKRHGRTPGHGQHISEGRRRY